MTNDATGFVTVDPFNGMTGSVQGKVRNLVTARWTDAEQLRDDILDPLNGERFLQVPDTQDTAPYLAGLQSCPKSGLLTSELFGPFQVVSSSGDDDLPAVLEIFEKSTPALI
jgi:hypothetical protein